MTPGRLEGFTSTSGRVMTITGTRSIDHVPAAQLAGIFNAYLAPFALHGRRYLVGGAIGIDTLALDWLAANTQTEITVVVPCTVADQPARSREAIAHWHQQHRIASIVELGAPELGRTAYHARNRWMVDRSEFVIGFPHGDNPDSGTHYTLSYAAEHDKPRLIVPV